MNTAPSPSDTTYYRTVVTIEVLSDEPVGDVGITDLADLAYQVTDGHMSGAIIDCTTETVAPERMAALLTAQGSDPAFLLGDEYEEEELLT